MICRLEDHDEGFDRSTHAASCGAMRLRKDKHRLIAQRALAAQLIVC